MTSNGVMQHIAARTAPITPVVMRVWSRMAGELLARVDRYGGVRPRGQKTSYGCRRRRRRTVPDDDRGRGDWGLPLQSDGTHARAAEETDRPAAAARR